MDPPGRSKARRVSDGLKILRLLFTHFGACRRAASPPVFSCWLHPSSVVRYIEIPNGGFLFALSRENLITVLVYPSTAYLLCRFYWIHPSSGDCIYLFWEVFMKKAMNSQGHCFRSLRTVGIRILVNKERQLAFEWPRFSIPDNVECLVEVERSYRRCFPWPDADAPLMQLLYTCCFQFDFCELVCGPFGLPGYCLRQVAKQHKASN